MSRAFRLSVLAILVAAAWPAFAGQAQERPMFRSELDLVPVTAVVRDRNGRVVTGLHKEDFFVVDAGAWRPISGFTEDTASPASLALLVDESGSMRENGVLTRQVLATLLGELGSSAEKGDQVALLGFDSSVHELQPFTPDFGLVRAALDRVDPFGATAVHDAIAATARRLANLGGRRALVVVSDGLDNRSRLTLQEVSGIASAIDVPVYIVLTSWSAEGAGATSAEAVQAPLQNLARWTGGEAFAAAGPAAIQAAAQHIVSDLRHQYLIAFESAPEPGWRTLQIQTIRPGLTVRARSAYVAGREGLTSVR